MTALRPWQELLAEADDQAPGIEGFAMPTEPELGEDPGEHDRPDEIPSDWLGDDPRASGCELCQAHVEQEYPELEARAISLGVDLEAELPGYLRTYHDAGHRDPSGPGPEEVPLR